MHVNARHFSVKSTLQYPFCFSLYGSEINFKLCPNSGISKFNTKIHHFIFIICTTKYKEKAETHSTVVALSGRSNCITKLWVILRVNRSGYKGQFKAHGQHWHQLHNKGTCKAEVTNNQSNCNRNKYIILKKLKKNDLIFQFQQSALLQKVSKSNVCKR